jgi:hypothetical protein
VRHNDNLIPLLFLSFLFSFSGLAQTKEILAGKVVDSKTGGPVPYASIRVKNKSIGVISNDAGDFQLPMWVKAHGDTIIVSSIGYSTGRFSFNIFNSTSITTLGIAPAVTELSEAVVVGKKRRGWNGKTEPSTTGIVQRAIRYIPKNYPQAPFSYVGYYRDYQVRTGSYVNLNEAIVQVFDQGFPSNDQKQTEIELYEYKSNSDFPRDSSMDVPYDNKPNAYDKMKNKYIPNAFLFSYGGNELSILRLHDAIRNYDQQSYSFVNVFSKDFLMNHALKRKDDIYLDTLALYCISFESVYRASGPMHFAKGKIYIDKRTFGIHKLEYAVYNKTMRETILMYHIKLEYARHGDKLYLNYISFNNIFKLQNDVDFKVIKMEYNPILNAFQASFNAPPNLEDLKTVSNYSIKLKGAPLVVTHIEKQEERKALIYLNDAGRDLMRQEGNNVSSNLEFSITLRDINNRLLDRHTVEAISQFRELFVEQVYTNKTTDQNSRFIRKDIPLVANPTRSKPEDEYWMNPPLLKR